MWKSIYEEIYRDVKGLLMLAAIMLLLLTPGWLGFALLQLWHALIKAVGL